MFKQEKCCYNCQIIFYCSTFFTRLPGFSAQEDMKPKLVVQLLLNTKGGRTADGVVAFYADNFTTQVGNEDSYKWTKLDENVAISNKGQLLSIEGRPIIHSSDTLNLTMWQFRQKSYYLELKAQLF